MVATLHDYTLVCVSGGQRVHAAENHVCATIDAERCSRCFAESPFARQLAAGRLTRGRSGRALGRAAAMLRRLAPVAAEAVSQHVPAPGVAPSEIRRRLAYARHLFESVDLVVAPSVSLRDEFVTLGIPPDRMVVSDYGFVPAGAVDRKVWNGMQPRRIGFVGTLVWHKGAHVLVDALRGLRGEFEVHLYGDPSMFPGYVERLQQSAKGLPVSFHGGFERESMRAVYGNLDVLVVPSLWPENSPLVIHEAFMHGVPVIAARAGGIEGLIQDGVNGLLYDARSVDQLRGQLQRVIDDVALLETMAAAAPAVKSIGEDAREWDERYAAEHVADAAPAVVNV